LPCVYSATRSTAGTAAMAVAAVTDLPS